MLDTGDKANKNQTDMSELEARLSETIEQLLVHGKIMSESPAAEDRARIFAAMVADAHTAHLG